MPDRRLAGADFRALGCQPLEFLRAVDVVLGEVARKPERYPVLHGTARRALLRPPPLRRVLRRTVGLGQRRCLPARAARRETVAGAHQG